MKVSLTDFKKLYAQEYDLNNVNVQFYKLEDIKNSPMVLNVFSYNEAIATMKMSRAIDWQLFTRTCLGSEKYYESYDSWDGNKIKYLDLKDVIRVDTKAEIDYVNVGVSATYEMSYLRLYLGTFDKENWFIFDIAHFGDSQFNIDVLKHCNVKVVNSWFDSMKIYKNQPTDITKYIELYASRYAGKVKASIEREQEGIKLEKAHRIKMMCLQNALSSEFTDFDSIKFVKDDYDYNDSHVELNYKFDKDTNIDIAIWFITEWSSQYKKEIKLYRLTYNYIGLDDYGDEVEYDFLESELDDMINFIKVGIKMGKLRVKYTDDATARYKE